MISAFPSTNFYSSKLEDGNSVLTRVLDPEIIELTKNFGKLVFFDLIDSSESLDNSNSKKNVFEARFTSELIKFMESIVNKLTYTVNEKTTKSRTLKNRIGIVTPYKAHIKLFFMPGVFGKNLKKGHVEIDTVDSY